jgi:hypothetical protein
MCLNGFIPLFFSGLVTVSFCSLIYLHIPQTNINSSNAAEVPITLISNLCDLIPINYKKKSPSETECGPCPVFTCYTLAFALQLRKITENSVTVAEKMVVEDPDSPG